VQWHLTFWLTHSKGFGKIVIFKGLDATFRVIPSLLTNFNFLTRQPFYFMKDIEAIGCLDLGETGKWTKKQKDTMAIADSYLFHYSLQNPRSRLTARYPTSDPMRQYAMFFLDKQTDENPEYIYVDNGNVRFHEPDFIARHLAYGATLGYFQCNEPGVDAEIIPAFNQAYEAYKEGLAEFIRTQEGKIEILNDPYAACDLEKLFFFDPPHNASQDEIKESFGRIGIFDELKFPPVEFVECSDKYDQTLLDFYFAALSDMSPLTQFKNYYNIIEYYFEDAAIQNLQSDLTTELNKRMQELSNADSLSSLMSLLTKKKIDSSGMKISDYLNEEEQLKMVLDQYVTSDKISCFLQSLEPDAQNHLTSGMPSFNLQPLNHGDPHLTNNTAKRIYKVRNGIFHSKRGQNLIVPFSEETDEFIHRENQLLKFIAQQIILSTAIESIAQRNNGTS